ncbi:hypothetical protein ACHAWU_007352 [Discostella pseudostelligera]|uniref:Uncharacterized protein n=1 Tax=Discostella pseudostelligera TaxID=259834 RepID=A0ABD3LZS9_9STRA
MNRQRRRQSASGGAGGSTLSGSPMSSYRIRRPGCTTTTHFLLILLIFIWNRSSISNNLEHANSNVITIPASSPLTSSSTAAAAASTSSGISGSISFAMAFQFHTVPHYRGKTTTVTIRTSSITSYLFPTHRQRQCDHLPLAADRHDYNLSRLEGRSGRGRYYCNRATTTVAITTTRSHTTLFSKLNNDASNDDAKNDYDDGGEHGDDDNIPTTISTSSSSSSIFQRFLNPRIDDPGLLLSDALLAQIVAPTLQIYWLLLVNGPSPSWLHPITGGVSSSAAATSSLYGAFSSRGTLLAPTLVHGAGLAVCWLAGALAARMFEREAFTLQSTSSTTKESESNYTKKSSDVIDSTINIIRSYQPILTRLIQAGAFSSGMLILATQLDLLLEYRGNIVTVGMSDEIDFRLKGW